MTDGGDASDQDRMRVALEYFIDCVIVMRQRSKQERRADGEDRPLGAGEPGGAAHAVAPSRAIGKIMRRGEDVDPKRAAGANRGERQ
jgi:hypothetical protein